MPSPQASAALAHRARRLALLRRRVLATALATFALAFGAVAVDGSMGSQSTATKAAVTRTEGQPEGATNGDDRLVDDVPAETGSTDDALTTGQS